MSGLGIKGRLAACFVAVLALVAAVLVPLMLRQLANTINTAEERELDNTRVAFVAAVANSTRAGAQMALMVAETPDVKTAFAARDRDRLAQLFVEPFAALKNTYGVDQMQFHVPPPRPSSASTCRRSSATTCPRSAARWSRPTAAASR